jgi:hypothetical protein
MVADEVTHVKTALEFTVTAQLHKDSFVERKTNEV